MLLSFIRLNNSHPNLVSVLTRSFKSDNERVFHLTKNLDYLINTYYFKEKGKVYNNKVDLYTYNVYDEYST